MLHNLTFTGAVNNAGALKQLGITEVWLDGNANDLPWRLVIDCDKGCSYRNGIPVSVAFLASHPASGLRFRWHFDLEFRGANGSAEFHIDVDGCRRVLRAVPEHARATFRELLRVTANAVRDKGVEYQQVADRQAVAARVLSDLCGAEAQT